MAKLLPIFREPAWDEPEDDFSLFTLGGMAQWDQLTVARAYKAAGDAVVKKALKESDLSYEFAFPVLFLYRHTIELHLKLIVQPKVPTHGLMKLARQFKAVAKSKLKQDVPDWVMDYIREFSDIDPISANFRYTKRTDGKHNWMPGEYTVSYRHVRRVVRVLCAGFEKAYLALGRPGHRI